MSMSTKTLQEKKRKNFIVGLIILIIVIPIILNLLLIQPQLFRIIEKDTTSAVWLQFWGSYLSAIGAIIMAILTYVMIRQENLRYECDHENRDYDILEKLIIKNEKIHNIEQVQLITNTYVNEGYAPAQKLCLELLLEVQNVANELIKFNNHADPNYQQYGIVLSSINQRLYYILLDLQAQMKWHENISSKPEQNENTTYLSQNGYPIEKNKNVDMQYFNKFAQYYYDQTIKDDTPYLRLTRLGNMLLQNRYKFIQEKTNQLK